MGFFVSHLGRICIESLSTVGDFVGSGDLTGESVAEGRFADLPIADKLNVDIVWIDQRIRVTSQIFDSSVFTFVEHVFWRIVQVVVPQIDARICAKCANFLELTTASQIVESFLLGQLANVVIV